MPDIKTKDTVRDIKVVDKSAIAKESMKRAAIRAKDTAENLSDDGQVSPSEYAEDNIKYMAEDTVDDAGHVVKKGTDKVVEKGNSGDSCRENHYPVGYYEILGYGILNP